MIDPLTLGSDQIAQLNRPLLGWGRHFNEPNERDQAKKQAVGNYL